MKTWFTSDPHYHHRNIIRYCQRPYLNAAGEPDVQAMNRDLIQRWNARVEPRDTVYLLGDVAFGSLAGIADIRKKLRGRIVLVRGNHDRSAEKMREAGFEEVHESLEVVVSGKRLHLSHMPPGYDTLPDCDYFLCGHVHEAWAQKFWVTKKVQIINVGVDVRGYQPVSLEELLASLP